MLCEIRPRGEILKVPELSIEHKGFKLEACLVPWDTDVFGFSIAQITHLNIEDTNQASVGFEALFQWADMNDVRMISCRLLHDQVSTSFLLEQYGFKFIEMVLHPFTENLHGANFPEQGLQISEVPAHEVIIVQDLAENCFAYERFHADPRLSTALADERYGKWVKNSHESSNQILLKIEDNHQIIAFFVIENLPENEVYWHLTAVSPDCQGRGYGFKAWLAMLGKHKADGINRVSTTISARNSRVLDLYSHLQFRFSPPEMTFHWLAE